MIHQVLNYARTRTQILRSSTLPCAIREYHPGLMHSVIARSTRRTTRLDIDIRVEARVPLWVFEKLLFAVIGAEVMLFVPVRSPELCRILIDDCKTDRIRRYAENTRP